MPLFIFQPAPEAPTKLTVDVEKIKTHQYFDVKQVTVGTSAIQVSSESIACKQVILKADNDNSGDIYVGKDSSVSSANGFRLMPGEAVTIPIDDLSKIWVIATTSGQKLYVIWVW